LNKQKPISISCMHGVALLDQLTAYHITLPAEKMTASKLHQIFWINKQAVDLMKDMRYMPAAALLSQGIAKLEAFVDETNATALHMSLIDCDYQEYQQPQGTQFAAQIIPISSHPIVNAGETLNPYQLCVAASSLMALTPQLHDENIFGSESQHSKLSCILYYNMGLCFQLHALSGSRRASSYLRDAHLSYQTALGLLDEGSQEFSDMQLELALLNNFGHLHYSVLNMEATATCLERMQFILCDITDDGDEPVPEDLQCFYLNLIHNENLQLRAAPVA